MFRDNKKFPTILFVMSALFAFVVFMMIVFVFLTNVKYGKINKANLIVNRDSGEELFLNLDYEHKDPYTTKIPQLRDMLSGPIVTELDPSLGDVNSSVTLVLFSDFECSYCAKQEKVLKEALRKYNVRLVWKDYPTSDPESRSFRAAVAARCAQSENAFWDYHDLLFQNDSDLSRNNLLAIADKLHLDSDEFSTCLDNSFTSQLIYDDMLEAEALGITGIPFLYVNDQEMLGEINKKDLEQLIEIEINKTK